MPAYPNVPPEKAAQIRKEHAEKMQRLRDERAQFIEDEDARVAADIERLQKKLGIDQPIAGFYCTRGRYDEPPYPNGGPKRMPSRSMSARSANKRG